MTQPIMDQVHQGLIVSCQALEDEPLHGAETMAKMARAAQIGGAVAIRANGIQDITSIKKTTKLPIIGIIKREYRGSDVYITPTLREVQELMEAGVDLVALDATLRARPNGEKLESLIAYMKERGQKVMADISTLDEGIYAASLGVDCVSTTLSGYTPYSPQKDDPDCDLVMEAVKRLPIPVLAEGKIHTPAQAAQMLKFGAHAVVVGSAITRPQLITKRYAAEMKKVFEA
ncbi:N-acetylmannosamine-6-phosphate 2-epimerase [Paenibacillus faecalis]|uniref:N-acetylmannosamine-6-phosphate 2-epimerase n=1 Tax=Paenibacillus faecalis TaxID=2079532 RepID=UPI000D112EB2|nr:N-acetylmannosamine-6-phosphate 2-epimerase [Paenibacillus faecalis]